MGFDVKKVRFHSIQFDCFTTRGPKTPKAVTESKIVLIYLWPTFFQLSLGKFQTLKHLSTLVYWRRYICSSDGKANILPAKKFAILFHSILCSADDLICGRRFFATIAKTKILFEGKGEAGGSEGGSEGGSGGLG